jgi:hypothetical protein
MERINSMIPRLVMLALLLGAPIAFGTPSVAKERTAAEQALYEKALKDCNSPQYVNGARMEIDYAKGTYRCIRIESNGPR